jgi:hypothetical protein
MFAIDRKPRQDCSRAPPARCEYHQWKRYDDASHLKTEPEVIAHVTLLNSVTDIYMFRYRKAD